MLSQSRHQLNVVPAEQNWTHQELAEYLQSGGELYKVSGLRSMYHQNAANKVFINGEVFLVDEAFAEYAKKLCAQDVLTQADVPFNAQMLELLCGLLNRGYWFAE
jgi:50S ribosomal protein L16 3-hydroxylase